LAIAEEVTLKGDHERRPDMVLYINGIAFAVIELKKSSTRCATRNARWELVHDFVLFDGGRKKLQRGRKYFDIEAA
jgi:type I site-specific restriction-modification system R (restriction) subunit